MSTAAPHSSFGEIVVELAWRPVRSRAVAATLAKQQTAARLGQVQREQAMDAAEEAELIVRLAELCPDDEDLVPGTPGARKGWTPAEEEAGVSEFFSDELGHALNVSRGTAAFRAKRAFSWRDRLPATFA